MNALELTKQVLGLAPVRPMEMDRKLLVDSLGRTLPMQYGGLGSLLNGAPAQWLGTEGNDLTRNGYSNHGTAYSIIKYILNAGQSIPWAVYKLDRQDNLAKPQPGHPFASLLYRPNKKQSWAQLRLAQKGYLLTTGNCYFYRVKPAFGSLPGKTAELWALPAPLVEVLGGGWMQEVTGYRIPDGRGGYINYAAEEVLHIKYWNPDDSRYGLSPIAAGIDSVTAAKAGLTSRVRQYQNEGPPGLLHGKGGGDAWTPEQADRVQGWFLSFFGGGKRRGNIPIVNQEMGFLNMGLSPVDLDVLAAIPHDKDSVADLFSFPGQLLNGSKGTTFNNMGEASTGLFTRCVLPLETEIRDGLNFFLGEEFDDEAYLDFDTSGIPELQEDLGKLVETLSKAYWMTTQEKQKRMKLEADEELPKYFIPAGLVSSDTLGAPATDEVPLTE